ncbi:Gfo/Idh/MocA family protein [Terrisporobacter glycolicus]|uniref:Inositol 2-dehydrogenase/D-chiro-inositol 3-dehydrogenase n=1 Tax=Terrisporobacter glycolicus ATCC 14880 = DSM 1288 TaxID=1121315 RepID=A0ABZ2ETU4_9FIRM|nr:Gfo/Idh/MocA family oxidoreductase [Terrisporobacter glycolicus]
MKKISVAVIGAGSRGMNAYAPYLLENPNLGEIVAVAEPKDEKRNNFKNRYNIKEENTYSSYEELLSKPKLADAIIIANSDESHFEPTKTALEKGYHVLLEKPMSNKLEEVIKLGQLAKKHKDQVFVICHVLRYTPFFSELKRIVDSKELGNLISIQHNENIGYYHFAHSYTRGNWRNSHETSPLILAKSCHDMDILLWLTGKSCKYISSFGSLSHMKEESFKENMANKCVDCKAERACPYSAKKIYLEDDVLKASLYAVDANPTKENLAKAITTGPYGRCVYKCDNNVVDHMVSIFEFEDNITATFNLSAFTKDCTRTIKLMFSHGEVGGDFHKNVIEVHKFGDNHHTVIHPKVIKSGHGGGDFKLMEEFVKAVSLNNKEVKTGAITSVESHVMAFAGEYSRLNHEVVNVKKFWNNQI